MTGGKLSTQVLITRRFTKDRGTPLLHLFKLYLLIITTGSSDTMKFNGSAPRALFEPKIPPAKNQGDVLLSRSGSAKLELSSTQ